MINTDNSKNRNSPHYLPTPM